MEGGVFGHLNFVEKLVAVVSGGCLAYITVLSNFTQADLSAQKGQLEVQRAQLDELGKRQELALEQRKDDREAVKLHSALTRDIFEEFVKAITDQNTADAQRLDRLEGVLVLTYAIPDARQQEGMGRAVQKAMERINTPALATRVKEASFDADELLTAAAQQQHAAPPKRAPVEEGVVRWSNYDFDVFWCEGVEDSAQLQTRASDILAFRALDPKASGRWRSRPLPKGINSRPGYGISGYEIRYSSADEKPLAEALKAQIEAKYPPVKIDLVSTSRSTPWYLSVFLCPAA